MNKKGFSLDKETLIVLLILLFFLVIVVVGYNRIYKGSEISKEGLLNCKSVSGECVLQGQCTEGQEAKQATGCTSEQVCCITKESLIKTT